MPEILEIDSILREGDPPDGMCERKGSKSMLKVASASPQRQQPSSTISHNIVINKPAKSHGSLLICSLEGHHLSIAYEWFSRMLGFR